MHYLLMNKHLNDCSIKCPNMFTKITNTLLFKNLIICWLPATILVNSQELTYFCKFFVFFFLFRIWFFFSIIYDCVHIATHSTTLCLLNCVPSLLNNFNTSRTWLKIIHWRYFKITKKCGRGMGRGGGGVSKLHCKLHIWNWFFFHWMSCIND